MSWPARACDSAMMVRRFFSPIEVMKSHVTSTFSFSPHSLHSLTIVSLALGTQWSHHPQASLPAAWAPRTYGAATAALVANAVCARKRRRDSLEAGIDNVLPRSNANDRPGGG